MKRFCGVLMTVGGAMILLFGESSIVPMSPALLKSIGFAAFLYGLLLWVRVGHSESN